MATPLRDHNLLNFDIQKPGSMNNADDVYMLFIDDFIDDTVLIEQQFSDGSVSYFRNRLAGGGVII